MKKIKGKTDKPVSPTATNESEAGPAEQSIAALDRDRQLIAHAFEWLTAEQPENAMVTHHGISCSQVIFRSNVSLAPIAPASRPTFIFNIAEPDYVGDEAVNAFTSSEIKGIAALLSSAGIRIFDAWNGRGCVTASFSHAGFCGPTLRAAVDRYAKGCPTHPTEGVFCQCGWFSAGYSALVLPKEWA